MELNPCIANFSENTAHTSFISNHKALVSGWPATLVYSFIYFYNKTSVISVLLIKNREKYIYII